MTRRYRVVDDTSCYFVTSSTMWWMPIFLDSGMCDILLRSFAHCRENKGLRVFAFVIMPTHFHAIVACEHPDALPTTMRDLKRHTSLELTTLLEARAWRLPLRVFAKAAHSGKGNSRYKVWQDEFHPVAILSEAVFQQKADYLHQNPVRKGLVRAAEEWVYSSARAFETGEMAPMEIDVLEW